MLVLTRRKGESVNITVGGVTIRLTVIRDGHNVRLGFDAPAEAKILRYELGEAK